ncbi:DUF3810 domain-containing protein [Flavobacteriaceae bacterium]|nr:DUF3810 domain-containing protein [Flavobacteriaceae bacterium]
MHFRRELIVNLSVTILSLFLYFILISTSFWKTFYFDVFYPHLSYTERLVTKIAPLSFGDLLYFWLMFSSVRWIVILIRSRFKRYQEVIIRMLKGLNLAIILFYILWGLNYQRESVATTLELNVDSVDDFDIKQDLLSQIIAINNVHNILAISKDSVVNFDQVSLEDLIPEIASSYIQISDHLDIQPYRRTSVKPSLYSLPLSYFGFSGYLNPFTGEAQYNYKNPPSSQAMTVSHEIAHQLGFASESDANLLGIYNGLKCPNYWVNYSVQLSLLQYTLTEYLKSHPEDKEALINMLNPGILLQYNSRAKYWNQFDNPFEPLIKEAYSLFLKSNQQELGIKSYGNFIKSWVALNKSQQLY